MEELAIDFSQLDALAQAGRGRVDPLLRSILGTSTSAQEFLDTLKPALDEEDVPLPQLMKLIHLVLVTLMMDSGELVAHHDAG